MFSLFLSYSLIPIRLKESATKFPLIKRSNGESVAKLGLKLTYRSQGFKLESINTSNPKRSKQLFLCKAIFLTDSTTIFSIDKIVLMIKSYILFQIYPTSTPALSKYLKRADKDHLCPTSSCFASVFYTNF